MKISITFLLTCLLAQVGFSQGFNIDSVSHLNYQTLHQANLNDCWGYVDETGIEYAIVGTTKGTSIVSLANPQNPMEVFWNAGSESIWRDIQVYQDYAYITMEADDGLLIIDLSPLPESTNLPTATYFGQIGSITTSAHDIFIDTLGGWAYLCGANRGNGGMIILDIHTNPMAPMEVGEFDTWYCHDAFAQGNLLYGAHISDGLLSIIDVTDHSNPVLLNTQITPNSFTHNVWVTTTDQYAVTTDEIAGSFLTLYDVSNPLNISETDRIRSSPGLNIIPHNAFIKNDSLIISSYYTDGITVHDMSRPHNLVEIAAYDTHPLENGSFNGSWGVYPYLPSGLLLASDITEGLFVLQPNFVQASYYEGLVRDASTLLPLTDVLVSIQNDPQTDVSNMQGEWAVGTAIPGTKAVTFYKVAYEPQTIQVPFVAGQLLLDTIDLVPIQPIPVTIIVEDALTGNPIIGANTRLVVPQMTQDNQTNGFGESAFSVYYPGINNLIVGKWGYVTKCVDTLIDGNTGSITIQLLPGIYDDFSFDFGWTATSNQATTGFWQRGIPFYVGESTPTDDADFDCTNFAFVTGNESTASTDAYDVDNGSVTLYSPLFDLTNFSDPFVNFSRWYFNFYGPNAVDDSLIISLSNGTETAVIDLALPNVNVPNWQAKSVRVLDFMTPTSNMQLIVSSSDFNPNNNITEAAFDYFFVSNNSVLDNNELHFSTFSIVPNPARDVLFLHGGYEGVFEISSASGIQLKTGEISPTSTQVNIQDLASGVYFLKTSVGVLPFIKE